MSDVMTCPKGHDMVVYSETAYDPNIRLWSCAECKDFYIYRGDTLIERERSNRRRQVETYDEYVKRNGTYAQYLTKKKGKRR